jgi:hypothetical protein
MERGSEFNISEIGDIVSPGNLGIIGSVPVNLVTELG